jgi:hypothetical protein
MPEVQKAGYDAMIPGIILRCAVGAVLLLTFGSSAWPARMLRAPGGGTVRGLLIGVDKYPNLEGSDLAGSVADARDLYTALKGAGVPESNLQLVTDAAAVRERFVEEMNRLVDASKSGDLAIVAYSGHGMRAGRYHQWDEATHSQIVMSGFGHTPRNGHEIIVDGEMRAWYARLEAKGVDMLVVIDSCFSGGMRAPHPWAQKLKVRTLRLGADDAAADDGLRDSFQSIPMTGTEIRADAGNMLRLAFFAGAMDDSTVPELPAIDPANRDAVRGALSYFLARTIDGKVRAGALPTGDITRAQLFGFLQPNVLAASAGRQFMDFAPHREGGDIMQRVVFHIDDDAVPGVQPAGAGKPSETGSDEAVSAVEVEPVRLAITNGPTTLASTIEPGRAPFVLTEPESAEIIWDVEHGAVLSRGDLIMDRVDGSILGAIIDRTYAVREIQKLAVTRIIRVEIGEKGRAFAIGEAPTLAVTGVHGNYLSVVNVTADGRLQMLYPSHEAAHMAADTWTSMLLVGPPLGADYAVAIATSGPAGDLLGWLRAHDQKHDAFALPTILAGQISTDGRTRLGTAGLFTH